MSSKAADPVEVCQALIRCKSVTPAEGGALDYLETLLAPLGLDCHRLPFAGPDTAEVDNLFARLGSRAPHLCFAGHTDVVPPGDETLWTHPPFAAEIVGDWLYGRGAVDMKGGVAAFVAALARVLEDEPDAIPGSVSFLITGDEEGPAVNGTVKVLDWMRDNGQTPDHCLVGEPSNPEALGDAIKIGRRGSHLARLVVRGAQGHVAYPALARNPIDGLLAVLARLKATPLDAGTEAFAPSNLEITSVDVGNEAENVIPAEARAAFNIRFNDLHTAEALRARIRETAASELAETGLTHTLDFSGNAEAFVTQPGPLIQTLSAAIREVTGRSPELSTSGGTSDARFIARDCPVVEFGLVNATIHQIDERTRLDDLETLTQIYARFIRDYFAAFA